MSQVGSSVKFEHGLQVSLLMVDMLKLRLSEDHRQKHELLAYNTDDGFCIGQVGEDFTRVAVIDVNPVDSSIRIYVTTTHELMESEEPTDRLSTAGQTTLWDALDRAKAPEDCRGGIYVVPFSAGDYDSACNLLVEWLLPIQSVDIIAVEEDQLITAVFGNEAIRRQLLIMEENKMDVSVLEGLVRNAILHDTASLSVWRNRHGVEYWELETRYYKVSQKP